MIMTTVHRRKTCIAYSKIMVTCALYNQHALDEMIMMKHGVTNFTQRLFT